MPDTKGARPYASYRPGTHPQDPAADAGTLSDPTTLRQALEEEVQSLVANLDADNPEYDYIRRALARGGTAWTNTPYALIVQALANIVSPIVAKLNLLIDTVDYLHLGQPGFVPTPDPGNEDPAFEYDPWPAPQYPSSLPDVDQDPIDPL